MDSKIKLWQRSIAKSFGFVTFFDRFCFFIISSNFNVCEGDTISSLNKKKHRHQDTTLDFETGSNMDDASQVGSLFKEGTDPQTGKIKNKFSIYNHQKF